ncbi:MAG: prepilin-type N-terminal cleavage/methylation domain-containing protein [Xanthomonadaceae bacterium]|nr:prepilin-type N-terminal cleavage/methylation domain-containing protein [Xanthomonadaceae bacterium]
MKFLPVRRHAAGFTLIELLMAIVILGIVLGIAIPNYRQWVIQSARAEGKTALFQVAQTLERCFTRIDRDAARWTTRGHRVPQLYPGKQRYARCQRQRRCRRLLVARPGCSFGPASVTAGLTHRAAC